MLDRNHKGRRAEAARSINVIEVAHLQHTRAHNARGLRPSQQRNRQHQIKHGRAKHYNEQDLEQQARQRHPHFREAADGKVCGTAKPAGNKTQHQRNHNHKQLHRGGNHNAGAHANCQIHQHIPAGNIRAQRITGNLKGQLAGHLQICGRGRGKHRHAKRVQCQPQHH